jgi:flagellar protein FliL
MAESETENGARPKNSMKMPAIIGLALAIVGGGGGFHAARSGLILAPESVAVDAAPGEMRTPAEVAYVPVEPLVISLGDGLSGRHLRFRAELEVVPAHRPEVERLMPRIVDVLNSYLRALKLEDVTDSSALMHLRAQMLRRLQVVTGGEGINDLLIMEFILN